MASFFRTRLGAGLVGLFLLVQLGVLWVSVSVSGYEQTSVFCTGPTSSRLSWAFGGLHLLFLALLVMGLLSIKALRLRAPYVGLLTAALVILPVQASLVHRGVLQCDLP
jgi:hypothetical protein